MMWIFYIALLMIWVGTCRWENRKKIKLSHQLKSKVPCLPIVGHAYKFIGNDEVQMKTYQSFGREAVKNGGLTSFWIGNILFITVADAVDADIVAKNYLEKGSIMRFIRAMIDNGSIFAPVSIWRPRRKILIPTFCPKNIQKFAQIFTEQSAIMSEKLKSRARTGPFSIFEYLTTYAMDSVCESTLGMSLKAQEDRDHPFIRAFQKGTKLVANRIVSPWQHNDIFFKLFPSYYSLQELKKFIKVFFNEIITSKRKELETKRKTVNSVNEAETESGKFKSFLELLIESSGGEKGYSDVELREEIQVLVMAGTDTSAVGAAFTVLMLSRHPDVQQTAYEELKEALGDSNRRITPDDLPKLKYLEAVIKESLRLYPPVPLIARQSDRDLTLPSGVTLVKDCVVMIHIWSLHRNPQYWGPDAELFKPERWFDENTLKHPAQFMPFSYGPRNCVGYQYAMTSMKTVVATMLSHYRILTDTKAGATKDGILKPLRLKFDIMMKDVENFTVTLENRT